MACSGTPQVSEPANISFSGWERSGSGHDDYKPVQTPVRANMPVISTLVFNESGPGWAFRTKHERRSDLHSTKWWKASRVFVISGSNTWSRKISLYRVPYMVLRLFLLRCQGSMRSECLINHISSSVGSRKEIKGRWLRFWTSNNLVCFLLTEILARI